MAIKDYHELILYWHDLQIASNNGYYNWGDGSIQDTNLSGKTQLEVKEMIGNFSTKLINYHLEHNPSFKANYDVEVQKYVAEGGLLEDIELGIKEGLVEGTKDYFVAYYEAYESLKNIEYKDIQNGVKKIWGFVSNPIDSIASTYEYAKTFTSELYEKILVLTGYEASKGTSYVGTTLGLSSADPAAKLIQLAGGGLFVKMGGKVDGLIEKTRVYVINNIENISGKISGGHAFTKHIDEFSEYGIYTPDELKNNIKNIISKADGTSNMKFGERGRIAYWDDLQEAVVIYDPNHIDLGTTFVPIEGKTYFNNLK